jgi:type IV secretory pathway VirJ component
MVSALKRQAMKKYLILIVLALFGLTGAHRLALPGSTFDFPPFGTVRLYPGPSAPAPERLTILITGDGGWSPTMNHLAEMLVHRRTAVLSINIAPYIKALRSHAGRCDYPAGDLENVAKAAERQLGFQEYHPPLLLGYSSGATLVYAALEQSPKSFAGGLSLGFCPDFPVTKPFCKGRGLRSKPDPKAHGVDFLADSAMDANWIVFQGDSDKVCDPAATEQYVRSIPKAEFIMLRNVGHGFSVWDRWRNQFDEALHTLAEPETMNRSSLPNLPLIELPAQSSGNAAADETLAIFISGDGGWAGIDREIAEELSKHGLPVVGFDSLRYFWLSRTPAEAAHALEQIISHYTQAWNRKRVIVLGYSFGADALPFMLSRLPPESLAKVSNAFFLGLDPQAEFEFHFGNWLGTHSPQAYPTRKELLSVHGPALHCFFGTDDTDDLCPKLAKTKVEQIALSGGHHFNGAYQAIAEQILNRLDPAATAAASR